MSTAPGVAFNPPPPSLLADATRIVAELVAQLPSDATGGVIAVATPRGWNAAVVHRAGSHFEIGSWIGKSWQGGVTGGGAVRASW